MRHPETGSARIIMRREKTMRVGKKLRTDLLANLFHRCVPTIPFFPGWTFAQTVGHRRWMLSYCWLFLQFWIALSWLIHFSLLQCMSERHGCGRRKQTLLTLFVRRTNQSKRWTKSSHYNHKLPVFDLQTLAIRFATIDNAEAFKAAFLEARQYVLENQVDFEILKVWLSKKLCFHQGKKD